MLHIRFFDLICLSCNILLSKFSHNNDLLFPKLKESNDNECDESGGTIYPSY